MDTNTARQIVVEVTALSELATAFQAKYGKGYSLKADSAPEAWTLHNRMRDHQRTLAGLLDSEALAQPQIRNRWWEQHDAMDIRTTQDLFFEAYQLLTRCVYAESANHDLRQSPGITCSQAIIAGMLHPAARQDPVRMVYAA
ncbi:MAG: hypothetical protein HXY40_00985 [Chloroflexi bacterium]|nr:hypothetical protein [Chloroflexota bacterium]